MARVGSAAWNEVVKSVEKVIDRMARTANEIDYAIAHELGISKRDADRFGVIAGKLRGTAQVLALELLEPDGSQLDRLLNFARGVGLFALAWLGTNALDVASEPVGKALGEVIEFVERARSDVESVMTRADGPMRAGDVALELGLPIADVLSHLGHYTDPGEVLTSATRLDEEVVAMLRAELSDDEAVQNRFLRPLQLDDPREGQLA